MSKWTLKRPDIDGHFFSQERFVRTVKRSAYAAWAALLGVIVCIVLLLTSVLRAPAQQDLATQWGRMTRVEFTATNFVRLWLTATDEDKQSLAAMLADPKSVPAAFNREPVTVADFNSTLAAPPHQDGKLTEWTVIVGVTIGVPGNDTAQRAYYQVNLVDKPGTAIKAVAVSLVNNARPGVTVKTGYPHQVSTDSQLAQSVTNFLNAFYTAGNSGALGRYVTPAFKEDPITNSPYSTVELVSLAAAESVAQKAKAGTTYHLLSTVKASMSTTTWNTMTIPMVVRANDSGQWVVDALSPTTRLDANPGP